MLYKEITVITHILKSALNTKLNNVWKMHNFLHVKSGGAYSNDCAVKC
jgi:hypothetical protein